MDQKDIGHLDFEPEEARTHRALRKVAREARQSEKSVHKAASSWRARHSKLATYASTMMLAAPSLLTSFGGYELGKAWDQSDRARDIA